MKVAKSSVEAWRVQESFVDEPHAWLQWKGTDACLDFYCECGEHTHFDGMFAYHLQCGKCGSVYFLNGHIEIIKLEEKPESVMVTFSGEEYDVAD